MIDFIMIFKQHLDTLRIYLCLSPFVRASYDSV